ncbi:phosphohexomutase domain-containing protein [Calycomorphotria hydatis]|uniref:Phosphomannomutase/phosphoglucomutase n=1 Tax=Calycomorphotria hydatis TaxID=2528027 RepID=A0A517TBI9_9PLAN|nr:hypothetical protein [Calycomorphotria hydatis]QDT65733.1 Phosphomannomutase/phosphoglucomutase [Calycomorphotria hydatis]
MELALTPSSDTQYNSKTESPHYADPDSYRDRLAVLIRRKIPTSTMSATELNIATFLCPGERVPVTAAVHRARWEAGFAGCRQCPFAPDSAESQHDLSPPVSNPFVTEGVRGLWREELSHDLLHQIGAAFAQFLWTSRLQSHSGTQLRGLELPTVVVGHGDHPLEQHTTMQLQEAIRRHGCHTIDVGNCSEPALQFAVSHLQASGGISISSNPAAPRMQEWRFFGEAGLPLSAGTNLDELQRLSEQHAARPTRQGGQSRRFDIAVPYEASLWRQFHGVGPIRLSVDCNNLMTMKLIERMVSALPLRIAEQSEDAGAHFHIHIDHTGTEFQCRDETGEAVDRATLTALLVSDVLREHPGSAVVLEWSLAEQLRGMIESLGGDVIGSNGTRAAMVLSMRDHSAIFGADTQNRYWHRDPIPTANAINPLAAVCRILSRERVPFSKLLHRTRLHAAA